MSETRDEMEFPCGSCQGRSGNRRRRNWRTHKSGLDHRIVCDCGASASWMPDVGMAVAAWNKMWSAPAAPSRDDLGRAAYEAYEAWARANLSRTIGVRPTWGQLPDHDREPWLRIGEAVAAVVNPGSEVARG